MPSVGGEASSVRRYFMTQNVGPKYFQLFASDLIHLIFSLAMQQYFASFLMKNSLLFFFGEQLFKGLKHIGKHLFE